MVTLILGPNLEVIRRSPWLLSDQWKLLYLTSDMKGIHNFRFSYMWCPHHIGIWWLLPIAGLSALEMEDPPPPPRHTSWVPDNWNLDDREGACIWTVVITVCGSVINSWVNTKMMTTRSCKILVGLPGTVWQRRAPSNLND